MSVDEEKKFVVKQVFENVENLKTGVYHYGKKEKHFNVSWRIGLYKYNSSPTFELIFDCEKTGMWSIDTTIDVKLFTQDGEETLKKNKNYSQSDSALSIIDGSPLANYLVDGNLAVECHVTINKMVGIEKPNMINFDESNKEFSDVVLIVKNKKFHVLKHFLAFHSSYFKSLLLGNFDESKQSEVELKDIDPNDFQDFLEVIHGEPAIDEDNVEEILQLADMYDSKTAIRRCEEFLILGSSQSLKLKFTTAVKYNMQKLQNKCISEMKNASDINSVMPENPDEFKPSVWQNLLKRSLTLYNNK